MAMQSLTGVPLWTRSMALTCTRGPNRSFNDDFIGALQRLHHRPDQGKQPPMSELPRLHIDPMHMELTQLQRRPFSLDSRHDAKDTVGSPDLCRDDGVVGQVVKQRYGDVVGSPHIRYPRSTFKCPGMVTRRRILTTATCRNRCPAPA